MRHMTTDYCRWLQWCTNNLYAPAKRPIIFRSLESIYRAYEDAYFVYEQEVAVADNPTRERESARYNLQTLELTSLACPCPQNGTGSNSQTSSWPPCRTNSNPHAGSGRGRGRGISNHKIGYDSERGVGLEGIGSRRIINDAT